ncbi:hypothetical protein GQ55_7G062200 [Panicum hallii var. hallii]|uniref:Uncharacterized protein n=1 Tax=Panicum hallii var. hallii TaxID=1504633 RepID=A0A2T7CSN3_9POAL|nr:hypothetical protein GQ55_7G062200 [Panicum hallii var. hallii]PUZ46333.1 hypothetical protein GQ55_7G062200 [Panicum hallii var. hallii]
MSSTADSKGCDANPKTEWPELVGCTIKEAMEKIKAERPHLNVQAVPVGTIVTQEIDRNRVRLWVDIVAEVPRIG